MKTTKLSLPPFTALSRRTFGKGKWSDSSERRESSETPTSFALPDYARSEWRPGELPLAIAQSIGVVALLAFFFYRSIWAVLPLSVIGGMYFRTLQKRNIRRNRMDLERQFRECIRSVAASLKAGYAVENAFRESEQDMLMLFGKRSAIYRELELIRRGLVLNITLEELLRSLAERSGSDAIGQFAEVFAIAKRGGGNLPEIIRESSSLISQQIDSRQEIQTLLSGRRMEQNIMKLVPFGILTYISVSNPGYFRDLYGNLRGVVIMTVLLGIYLVAYYMGDHILDSMEEH